MSLEDFEDEYDVYYSNGFQDKVSMLVGVCPSFDPHFVVPAFFAFVVIFYSYFLGSKGLWVAEIIDMSRIMENFAKKLFLFLFTAVVCKADEI